VLLRDLTGQQPDKELPGTPGTGMSTPVFAPGGDLLMWFTVSASQAVSVQLWDLRRDVEIPNRLGAIPGDVTGGWPTDDPGRVLLRHGTFGRDGTRLVVRSVADGSEVTTVAPGTAVAPGGAALVRIEQDPELRSPTTVAVDPPAGQGTARRLTTSDVNVGWSRLSADGGWFVERPVTGVDGDYQTLRLTALGTGEVRQVTIPAVPERDAATGSDQRLVGATSLGVVSAGGRTSVLLAQGTSVLRFATEQLPSAEEVQRRTTIGLGEPTVIAYYETAVATWDRRTGQRLGAVTGLGERWLGPVLDGNSVWIMSPVEGAWEIGHYELPTLRRITAFRIPDLRHAPSGELFYVGEEIDLVADGERVVVSHGGWLTAHDRTTGQPLGPPLQLGGTPQEISYSSAHANVWARPGHPGQVAVKVDGGRIQLWEMPARRLVHTFETSTEAGPAFDPSGTRMALPNRDGAIEVWDVDRGVLLRPPIVRPDRASWVVAFQPDGYLAVRAAENDREPPRLSFIELESGRQAGVMRLTGDIGTLDPEGQTVGLRTSYGDRMLNPADLRISAGGWRDALCAVADRPFTPAERALLPPGADPGPPCS
jgi:hypothetical protein